MNRIHQVKAATIPDAWFQCVFDVQAIGFKYIIEQGSFVGQTRLEFDWITLEITHPYAEPYFEMVNMRIPEGLGFPNPVAEGYVEEYLPYIMSDEKTEGEDYTYGERLTKNSLFDLNQVDHFIHLLHKTPNTNQAILQIAQPLDCLLEDPPCLRHIDMRIKDGVLIFYPYFRSWDLWAGLPANLAALAILQKYMADAIGVESGSIIAASKGLHIYGYVEELAKLRSGK